MKILFPWLVQRMTDPKYGFNAASEQEPLVFGARRPGFPFPRVSPPVVNAWITFMKAQGIQRVLCLLPPSQLESYEELLSSYRKAFGDHQVCWTPIDDFHLAEEAMLINQILPFLVDGKQQQEKTVVHCSGGVGRTGHVLAAWLVSVRGMTNEQALAAVKKSGRNAREAGGKKLDTLLNTCRAIFSHGTG